MKQLSWEEYYEKFYDWPESAQVRKLSALTSLGAADEVGEIIYALPSNGPAADCLLRKAVEAKLEFPADDLIWFLNFNDKALATEAVYNSANRLTSEDMEALYGEVDDEVVIDICSKRNLPLPEDLREEEESSEETREIGEEPLEEETFEERPLEAEPFQTAPLKEQSHGTDDAAREEPPKHGFFDVLFVILGTLFTALFAVFGALLSLFGSFGSAPKSGPRADKHRCNGDCENCPPHYGYRYGRWYYGHDRVRGCEFGGNKRSGGRD